MAGESSKSILAAILISAGIALFVNVLAGIFALTQTSLWPFGFTALLGGLFAVLGSWTVRR